MELLTVDQARERDWLCRCWVHASHVWCVTTGREAGYEYGDEEITTAVVLFISDASETSAIPLEHLECHHKAPGLCGELEEGERSAWEAGRDYGQREDVMR